MKKFEYSIHVSDSVDRDMYSFKEFLDAYGNEGWEYVGWKLFDTFEGSGHMGHIFKKEIK